MSTAERLMTAEEFCALSEPIEGGKMELVDGRVVMAPPANTGHGRRASRIDRALATFVESHGLGTTTGEGGYFLARDPDVVRAPDAAFVSSDRIPAGGIPDEGYFRGAPTLAVEVVSPEDRESDIAQKIDEYLSAGAERVWIVRPRNRTVTVHRPGGDSHTYSSDDVLTSADAGFSEVGFSLPLPEIFA
jgi:Uma2 family endonuclease